MHPTDDLVARGQVRIARAAAREAVQPAPMPGALHPASLGQPEHGAVFQRCQHDALVFRANGTVERIPGGRP